MQKSWFLLCAFAALLATAGSSSAQDCAPPQTTWLELTPTDNGYLVPVTIGGKPRRLLLELGLLSASIDERIVAEMKLTPRFTNAAIKFINGVRTEVPINPVVALPSVQMGAVTVENITAKVLSDPKDGIDGVTGLALFPGYNIELDLAHNRMGLLVPDRCERNAYWPHAVMGQRPFDIKNRLPYSNIKIVMSLDGKSVSAYVFVSEQASSMALQSAFHMFGIDGDDPNLVLENRNVHQIGSFTFDMSEYRYPFKSLSLGDVTLASPEILLTGGIAELCKNAFSRCTCPDTHCDLVLGADILRRMHILFDFQELEVYATPAEPAAAGKQ